MSQKEVGHQFLARLGKKRLRPGGVEATNWLIQQGEFSSDCKVLEVACNRCTTSIELAQTYQCHITAVDLDTKVLAEARKAIEAAQMQDYIHLTQANALKLPFADNSFDIVINEAMLTMLSDAAKEKALKEYWRVLKPGGRLLTHDVSYEADETKAIIEQLRDTINVNVSPLQLDAWRQLLVKSGFTAVNYSYGNMTLMSPLGMIKDEGVVDAIRIMLRGMKKENRKQFLKMRHFFNKTGRKLCYIAAVSQK